MLCSRRVVIHRWLVGLVVVVCWAGAPFDVLGQAERAWSLSAAPELQIGAATGDPAYLFHVIQSARFLPDGQIAVVDQGPLVIRLFGPIGEFRTEFGGRGQGPGEFRDIKGMWPTSQGTIAVWDDDNRRITTFSFDGDLEGTNSLGGFGEMPAGRLEVFFGAFENDDAVLVSLAGGSVPGGKTLIPDPWTMVRFALDGEFREQLGEVHGMWRIGMVPAPFSAMPHVVVHRGLIYRADDYEAEITVLDGSGAEVRTVQLPVVALSSDEAWGALEEELRRRESTLYLEQLDRGMVPRDDKFPQIGGMLVDDRGYIWVKVYDPSIDSLWLRTVSAMVIGPGGTWRVVSPEGELVATVQVPDNVRPVEIRGDRLLGVSRDEFDVERIVVYTIERN